MNHRLLRNALFGTIVVGYLYYAWRYILATSFVVDGTRYYILFDDAMISMRYAYNLAHGSGLVWNVGERVLGFTNPLWVIYMALLHLLPLSTANLSLAVQVTGCALLAANLFLVRWIVEQFTGNTAAMLAAVAFSASYAPLNSYGLLGMEVSALTLLISATVWLTLRNGQDRFSPWVYVLLAVGTLLRSDMAVPYVVVVAAMCRIQREHRTEHLLWGVGLLVLSLGGQSLAAYAYYGDWLPNTYYLKIEGWPIALRLLRGLYALVWFVYFTNWVLFLLPLSIFLFRRDWRVALPLAILLGQLAYSVFVGGDAWEDHGGANRYIVIAMPLFFASLAVAADALQKRATAVLPSRLGVLAKVGAPVAWLVLFASALLNFNLLLGDWKSIERWSLARRPDYVAGSDHNLGIALALARTTLPGASVAVIGAGTIPYLLPDDPVLDILGKTDPVIAHGAVRTPMSIEDIPYMRPGHMKWNYAHTFGDLRPDVIVSIWPGTSAEAEPYLKDYVSALIAPRTQVYLRKDSTKILWDRVTLAG